MPTPFHLAKNKGAAEYRTPAPTRGVAEHHLLAPMGWQNTTSPLRENVFPDFGVKS